MTATTTNIVTMPSAGNYPAGFSNYAGPEKMPKGRKQISRAGLRSVLKSINPDMSISAPALDIMHSYLDDLLVQVAADATERAKTAGREAVAAEDIRDSIVTLLPTTAE